MTIPTQATALAAAPRHRPVGRRVAVQNNKGGVGKTLLIVGLAEALARRGRQVLVVDLDPQANATRRLGVTPDAGGTLADLLRTPVRPGAAAAATYPCGWDGPEAARIEVLAAELALEDRALEAGVPGAAHRLAEILYGVEGYDYVLIDCQPSLGPLTQMALAALDNDGDGDPAAADTVLIPVIPDWDAVAGGRRMCEFIATYRKALTVPHLRPAGVVVNKLNRTNLHAVRLDELAAQFPDTPIWEPHLPERARIAEVQDAARPLASETDLIRAGLVGGSLPAAGSSRPQGIDAIAARLDGALVAA